MGLEQSVSVPEPIATILVDALPEEHLNQVELSVNTELVVPIEEPVNAGDPDDLWQRIRLGYQLDLSNLPDTVVRQRKWYIDNPNYLKAVFSRAEPFIYYITDQLEQAGLPLELALLPIVESTYDPLASVSYTHLTLPTIYSV